MDARALLRQYLEQRRELGERELQLDDMSVEEALKIIAVAPAASGEKRRRSTVIDEERESAPETAPNPDSLRAKAADLPGDWREALRAAGADPNAMRGGSKPAQPAKPTPPRESPPSTPVESAAPVEATAKPKIGRNEFPAPSDMNSTAEAIAPPGLVVGAEAVERFGGVAGQCDTLDAIAELVASCTRCPLYSTALNPVPGDGNPNADFMCVGEAPGQTEDETGRPFVGAAGQLLTNILKAIKLSREDVFIANVLKHRPPGNRNPTPEEVTACSPYLIRQIQLVRPKVILALGTFASQTLLETKLPISKLRGQIHRYHGVPLIVTFHPAALLRNPAWKRPTWEDVQLARRVLDSARPNA